jgi:hypothetical protein
LDEYKANKTSIEEERDKAHARLLELKTALLIADEGQTIEKRLKDVHGLLTDETIDFEIKYHTAHFLINKITYEKEAKTSKLQYKL